MRLPIASYNPLSLRGSSAIAIPAPYSFWRMEEIGNTTPRVDSVGGRDLSASLEVDGVPGHIGNGASFPAFPTDDMLYRDGSNALSFGDVDFEWVMWFKSVNVAGNGYLAAQCDGLFNFTYALSHMMGAGDLNWSVWAADGTGTSVTLPAAAPAGTWYMVDCYHDSVGNQIGISINNGPFNSTAWIKGVKSVTNRFTIAGSAIGSPRWKGIVDAVGVFTTILTPTQRTALYNSGAGLEYYGGAWH